MKIETIYSAGKSGNSEFDKLIEYVRESFAAEPPTPIFPVVQLQCNQFGIFQKLGHSIPGFDTSF